MYLRTDKTAGKEISKLGKRLKETLWNEKQKGKDLKIRMKKRRKKKI